MCVSTGLFGLVGQAWRGDFLLFGLEMDHEFRIVPGAGLKKEIHYVYLSYFGNFTIAKAGLDVLLQLHYAYLCAELLYLNFLDNFPGFSQENQVRCLENQSTGLILKDLLTFKIIVGQSDA